MINFVLRQKYGRNKRKMWLTLFWGFCWGIPQILISKKKVLFSHSYMGQSLYGVIFIAQNVAVRW